MVSQETKPQILREMTETRPDAANLLYETQTPHHTDIRKVLKTMRVLSKGYESQPEITFTAKREDKWSTHKSIIQWFETLRYD